MKKNKFLIVIIIILLTSCASITRLSSETQTTNSSLETQTVSRVIILDNETIFEEDVGGFTSWYCYDSVYERRGVLFEFGYFNHPKFDGTGFFLYEGGDTGEFTHYQRTGLEHRWDWGPRGANYSFVIKADGTGLYYDFTGVPEGESIKPKDIFNCYRR